MKDYNNPALQYELVIEQAGQLLVSLGHLLRNLPELCEDGAKAGVLLERIGGKLSMQRSMQIKTIARMA